MRLYKSNTCFFAACLLVLFCVLTKAASAQQEDTVTADGLLVAAKHAAFNQGNYPLAKAFCIKALAQSPDYADIRIFLGRLYAWGKQYDSARSCFKTVLYKQPSYEDASLADADVEYWDDHYVQALQIVDAGLGFHPTSNELLLRKAKILNALRLYKQADSAVTAVLKRDRGNSEAMALANRIKDNVAVNKVSISYDYVHFDQKFPSTDPWHLVSLDYTRQTKLGSVTGRVNYANRFKENGMQYELEAYPHISKTFYAYMSAGYSDNVGVFPNWRGGFSLYANLPKSFEGELGWRYLYFSSSTNIFTAYLGKYYKSWLFGVRTYITPGGAGLSQSYNASARYYFGGADDYLGLTVGSGVSPDDRAISQLIKNNLQTYKAALDFKHTIGTFNVIVFGASIINQELQTGVKGNQVQVGAGYVRRF